jgi:hypothetical protein
MGLAAPAGASRTRPPTRKGCAGGEILYRALFPPRIARLWSGAVGGLAEDAGLRIRLHIDVPELMALPWELIFDDEYIGLHLRFPIVRTLDLPTPPRPLGVEPPLRVLVAAAQPKTRGRWGWPPKWPRFARPSCNCPARWRWGPGPARRDERWPAAEGITCCTLSATAPSGMGGLSRLRMPTARQTRPLRP